MSQLEISNFTDLENKKSEILEELNELWCEDIGKLHVSELLLKYYENSRAKIILTNPWTSSDNAARQLHSASTKIRRPYLGRSIVKDLPSNFSKANIRNNINPLSINERTKRRELAQNQKIVETDESTLSIVSANSLEILAAHISETAASRASLESELSNLSEELTKCALSKAEYINAIHSMAVELIAKVILEAERHIQIEMNPREDHGENLYNLSRESTELPIERIESIASNMIFHIKEKAYQNLNMNED